jgi:hypothetical protein
VGYSGLAPTVRASGERPENGTIIREGRAELRGVWVQIAHLAAIDNNKEKAPLPRWFGRVASRRGKKTATVDFRSGAWVDDGTLRLLDVETGRKLQKMAGTPKGIQGWYSRRMAAAP